MVNGVIKEITNYDELKEALEIIIKTYKDRDEKMNLSNENNHRHSNMTYELILDKIYNHYYIQIIVIQHQIKLI